MKKLNVAIIGQGRSGRNIHGAFFKSENNTKYNVVAVVDLLAERCEWAKKEFGCDTYTDYRELYKRKDIDLVINSTFSHLHYPITKDLLTHGFNVVEKPFSAHREECEDMISTAEKNHVMLCIFQQSHFAPYYHKLREIMDSGLLGRIVEIRMNFSSFARRWDWQCSQRFYGGSLRNTGPHPLEQALDILGPETMPRIVSRLDSANSFGDAEDFVKILMLAPGKPVIDLEISSCDAYNDGILYRVQGTCGNLKATMNHVSYQYFLPEEAGERHLILEPLSKEDGTPSYCTDDLHWYKVEDDLDGTSFNKAVEEYYDNIYAHLTNGAPLIIQPGRILRQIELIEEVHRQNPMPVRY